MRCSAALLLAVVALAGCGDELGDFRNEKLNPLEERADAQRSEISAVLQRVQLGDRADAEGLRAKIVPLEQTFEELSKLDAPDEYDRTYLDFVKANSRFIAQLRAFAAALEAGREDDVQQASKRARQAIAEAQEAILPLHE